MRGVAEEKEEGEKSSKRRHLATNNSPIICHFFLKSPNFETLLEVALAGV